MKTKIKKLKILFSVGLIIGLANFGTAQKTKQINMELSIAPQNIAKDFHSYSNPQQIKVRHVDLDWMILFDKKVLQGTATLSVERAANAADAPLIWIRAI